MSQEFNVVVLGASGAVGQTMIEILEERDFPIANLYPLASSRSAGNTVTFKDKQVEILDVDTFDWSQAQIGFFLHAVVTYLKSGRLSPQSMAVW